MPGWVKLRPMKSWWVEWMVESIIETFPEPLCGVQRSDPQSTNCHNLDHGNARLDLMPLWANFPRRAGIWTIERLSWNFCSNTNPQKCKRLWNNCLICEFFSAKEIWCRIAFAHCSILIFCGQYYFRFFAKFGPFWKVFLQILSNFLEILVKSGTKQKQKEKKKLEWNLAKNLIVYHTVQSWCWQSLRSLTSQECNEIKTNAFGLFCSKSWQSSMHPYQTQCLVQSLCYLR